MKRTNFSFRRNQKGDLNLSINAIVVLILAITLLGLGLMFIRGTFTRATGELSQSLNELEKQRQEGFIASCSDDVCIDALSTDFKKGGTSKYTIVLNNKLDCELKDIPIKLGSNADSRGCRVFGEPQSPSVCDAFDVKSFPSTDVASKSKSTSLMQITIKNSAKTEVYEYPVLIEGDCKGLKFGGKIINLQIEVEG